MTNYPPVDRAHLASFTGGDESIDRDLLESFVEKSAVYLEQLASSVHSGWREMSHKIKGAARGIGAFDLGNLAEKAETLTSVEEKQEILLLMRENFENIRRYVNTLSEEQE